MTEVSQTKREKEREGGERQRETVGMYEKRKIQRATVSEQRAGGEKCKIRDRQVMQVCPRGRNKQSDCDRKSRRVRERESGRRRQTQSGKNNKYAQH